MTTVSVENRGGAEGHGRGATPISTPNVRGTSAAPPRRGRAQRGSAGGAGGVERARDQRPGARGQIAPLPRDCSLARRCPEPHPAPAGRTGGGRPTAFGVATTPNSPRG